MTSPNNRRQPFVLDAALEYADVGQLSVFPASARTKQPWEHWKWKSFQSERATPEQIRIMFADANSDDPKLVQDLACAIICGGISGNLEMIDFDRSGMDFPAWSASVRNERPDLMARLVVQQTQSDGRHVIYRCSEAIVHPSGQPIGNDHLAYHVVRPEPAEIIEEDGKPFGIIDDKMRRLTVDHATGELVAIVCSIETRGEGGYFLCDPSRGYHVIQGDLTTPPMISLADRNYLIEVAKRYDEKIAWKRTQMEAPRVPVSATIRHDTGGKPGDEYNARGDFRDVLRKHGWKQSHTADVNEHWTRPGKDSGTSATFKLDDRLFYVFSSNAHPFEPQNTYSPFGIYAMLECNGNFGEAASRLYREGYGERMKPREDHSLDHVNIEAILAETAKKQAQNEQEQTPEEERGIVWFDDLILAHPKMRDPLVHGLLREGEIMNIVAAPKVGKSWLVNSLALSFAMQQDWLDTFACVGGKVLIIDNELHSETAAHRLPVVAKAHGYDQREWGKRIAIEIQRGQALRSIMTYPKILGKFRPGEIKLVIVDALYRALPGDVSENDNAAVAGVYNALDQMAKQFACAFALVHHTSKGIQSGKNITDVGSGAGSQSRAADTHLILREHEQENHVSMHAVVRSWSPVDPMVLEWSYPRWSVAAGMDAAAMKSERPRRDRAASVAARQAETEDAAMRFVTTGWISRADLMLIMQDAGMTSSGSDSMAKRIWEYGHTDVGSKVVEVRGRGKAGSPYEYRKSGREGEE